MKTIKMIVEFTYDEEVMHHDDEEAIEWFFRDIIKGEALSVHSNEIGDFIGEIRVIEVGSGEK